MKYIKIAPVSGSKKVRTLGINKIPNIFKINTISRCKVIFFLRLKSPKRRLYTNINDIFINSLGWKLNPKMLYQHLLPLIDGAKKSKPNNNKQLMA